MPGLSAPHGTSIPLPERVLDNRSRAAVGSEIVTALGGMQEQGLLSGAALVRPCSAYHHCRFARIVQRAPAHHRVK
jgi:hypothetical protein